ncbi:hypothetical protein C8R45DRAFT_983415 [Mycena sanguinolenta]|nr:hypothetical protein C8R45DRAFT_983415 [Mycena sanguinolenta]
MRSNSTNKLQLLPMRLPSLALPVLLAGLGASAQTITGQYDCLPAGGYTLCQNLWGERIFRNPRLHAHRNNVKLDSFRRGLAKLDPEGRDDRKRLVGNELVA